MLDIVWVIFFIFILVVLTEDAWLSLVRTVRRQVKSCNERNPFNLSSLAILDYMVGYNPTEAGRTSSPMSPMCWAVSHATMERLQSVC